MSKERLRKEIKEMLQTISPQSHQYFSRQIEDNLYTLKAWQDAQTIGITISRGKEINTKSIIERGWQEDKMIAVPKCIPDTKAMVFRRIISFNQLEVVYYGLEEPIEETTPLVSASKINTLIVPGLAFDLNGYRLGYGGGYYDRYLAGFNGVTIALALEQQIITTVPTEDYDLPVHYIVTTERVINCNGK